MLHHRLFHLYSRFKLQDVIGFIPHLSICTQCFVFSIHNSITHNFTSVLTPTHFMALALVYTIIIAVSMLNILVPHDISVWTHQCVRNIRVSIFISGCLFLLLDAISVISPLHWVSYGIFHITLLNSFDKSVFTIAALGASSQKLFSQIKF